jgi:hypothetical protein
LRFEARTAASPAAVWDLLAKPARWHEWAPHIRGGSDLGDPDVQAGARGTVSLMGAPVPVRIVAVIRGRMWSWRVGPVEIGHHVEPMDDGTLIAFELDAPTGLALPLRVGYGPFTALMARNLARVAAQGEA